MWAVTLAAAVGCLAVLPPWSPTWNLAASTVQFPANFTGQYDVGLAAKFGLNMFDQSNGQLEWSANVQNFTASNDMEAFLLTQIADVKKINPHSRAFIYRSGQCALSYVSVFRETVTDPAKRSYWLMRARSTADGNSSPYKEASPGPFCPVLAASSTNRAANGAAHLKKVTPPPPKGWWPPGKYPGPLGMPAGDTCGYDYFWNFSNPAAAAFFYSEEALRLNDARVDGFFFDDVEGLGTEHPAVIAATGMTPAEVAAWNAARMPAYAAMHAQLQKHGKFEWHMFEDAEGNPVSTIGARSNPTNTSCAAWMRRTCKKDYSDVPLMMTLSSAFTLKWKGARPGTVLPQPYSFPWLQQQLAAFLLIRGEHAFVGTGWGVGLVHEWQSIYDTDFGEPKGSCVETSPNVYSRRWSKYNISLDCSSWTAAFDKL